MSVRVLSILLVATVGLSSWASAAGGEPLPEPPKPPRSARIQPPPEPVPAPALPSAPLARQLSYGSIVTEPVALYPHVRVKDACNVAPGAVPVVVAVRDPTACRKGPAGIVFVQVCVPTCPLCKCHVNRLGTAVELDYGKYEIDIVSRNGVVTIDYDD